MSLFRPCPSEDSCAECEGRSFLKTFMDRFAIWIEKIAAH
jgi:hypothetical protein